MLVIASTLLLSGALLGSSDACQDVSSVPFVFLLSSSDIAISMQALLSGGPLS